MCCSQFLVWTILKISNAFQQKLCDENFGMKEQLERVVSKLKNLNMLLQCMNSQVMIVLFRGNNDPDRRPNIAVRLAQYIHPEEALFDLKYIFQTSIGLRASGELLFILHFIKKGTIQMYSSSLPRFSRSISFWKSSTQMINTLNIMMFLLETSRSSMMRMQTPPKTHQLQSKGEESSPHF